ncbi:MAG: RidA family protein [Hydrococcus sp. RM1_1_31]|nr:RidA family protein [Hydrococcus sp. RM1_1_31]
MPKEYINPKTLFPSLKYGFSQIVTSQGGRTIYISGQTPWNAEEKIIGTTRHEQARQSLKNLQMAIEAVGGSPKDIVSLRIYMVDYQPEVDAEAIANELKAFFPEIRLQQPGSGFLPLL